MTKNLALGAAEMYFLPLHYPNFQTVKHLLMVWINTELYQWHTSWDVVGQA